MLQFQPPGFGQRVIKTSLGVMVYYTPVDLPWPAPDAEQRPLLVFLHSLGGGSSAYEWSKVYPAFAADYRVIAPDLIGWGQSAHPAHDYTVTDYLRMLTELLEAVGAAIGQPAAVVASSLTGGLTIRLAIQRPDLFRLLFLVAPAGYSDFGADYGQNLAARIAGIPGVDRLIYTLGAANEFAVRNFLEQFLFCERGRLTSETVAAYLTSALQFNAEYAALASLRGDLCFDLALYMAQLKTPTVLAWGQQSRFSSPATGQRLARLNPAYVRQLPPIERAGVLAHLECPAQVICQLRQVLQSD
ncbi:MAG: alpha/beta hydrolase [Cyanobacteria bacterium RM1_2_2]|nr:alpha/beta hydrolase [Cyanobacteria bacterium RM1_2_2]